MLQYCKFELDIHRHIHGMGSISRWINTMTSFCVYVYEGKKMYCSFTLPLFFWLKIFTYVCCNCSNLQYQLIGYWWITPKSWLTNSVLPQRSVSLSFKHNDGFCTHDVCVCVCTCLCVCIEDRETLIFSYIRIDLLRLVIVLPWYLSSFKGLNYVGELKHIYYSTLIYATCFWTQA